MDDCRVNNLYQIMSLTPNMTDTISRGAIFLAETWMSGKYHSKGFLILTPQLCISRSIYLFVSLRPKKGNVSYCYHIIMTGIHTFRATVKYCNRVKFFFLFQSFDDL